MDFLGLGMILFGHKSSSSSLSSTSSSTMESATKAELDPGLKGIAAPPHINHSCINRTNLLPSSHVDDKRKKKREFPPPIPLLARTENLPCHMPWVLKRCYVNGRLVLREVPVKHHEYFKAQRSNGRLVLRMMYMDDDQLHPKKNFNHLVVDDDGEVDKDVSSSVSSTEEEDLEEKEVESDKEEKGLDLKQEEEMKIAPIVRRVLSESMMYSSSLPDGRAGCSPKDGRNDFSRIGTPTIRPIYG